jgi:head-tail adaptor
MNAGDLNEVIDVYQVIYTKNSFGEEVESIVKKLTTRACVWHRSGGRRVSNDSIVYDYAKTIQVRYYVDIDDHDLIVWSGKTYRIMDIEPNKRDMCKTINIEEIVQ